MQIEDDLGRSRLTVFFRLLLAIPHYVWLILWSIAAIVVVVINWFATLIRGQSPQGLHNFLAAYTRYVTHFYSYLLLAAGRGRGHRRPVRRWRGRGHRLLLRERWGRVHRRLPRLVRLSRARPDAQRFQRPRGVRGALQRADDRVPVPGHRSL